MVVRRALTLLHLRMRSNWSSGVVHGGWRFSSIVLYLLADGFTALMSVTSGRNFPFVARTLKITCVNTSRHRAEPVSDNLSSKLSQTIPRISSLRTSSQLIQKSTQIHS